MPRYSQVISQLGWLTHAHNLRRIGREHRIDLYLRPPHAGAPALMDGGLMTRIVKVWILCWGASRGGWGGAVPSVSVLEEQLLQRTLRPKGRGQNIAKTLANLRTYGHAECKRGTRRGEGRQVEGRREESVDGAPPESQQLLGG
eukprot:7175-Chlamydomonas_euryale.AAC.1